MSVTIRQVNPPELTSPHPVTNPVILPVAQGSMLSELPLETIIHEFLFEVTIDGSLFWVGAAVPAGTTDFTRTQVYFHPTVVNGGTTHATEADYPQFKGGWSASIQRYVAMQGGQLAGARLMPLLVPFTTMSALSGRRGLNMFSDRPVETLNAIMAAIQTEIFPAESGSPLLTQMGVSSFSSGISALRLFLGRMSASGLVKEVIDFDSPYIVNEPKTLTRTLGAVSLCYTQYVLAQPEFGWVNLPAHTFAAVRSFSDAHSRIGWMMYYTAMLTSVII